MEWSDMRYMGWYGVIGCYRWKIRGLSFIIHHGLWWFIILSAQRPGVLSPSFARGWPLQWFSSRDLGAGKSWNMVEPAKMERHYKAKDIYKHTRIYKDHKDKNIELHLFIQRYIRINKWDSTFLYLYKDLDKWEYTKLKSSHFSIYPNQAGILAEDWPSGSSSTSWPRCRCRPRALWWPLGVLVARRWRGAAQLASAGTKAWKIWGSPRELSWLITFNYKNYQ